MIVSTVHLPSVYHSVSSELQTQAIYCNACIQLLQDIAENGVILVDENEVLLDRIKKRIGEWPEKHQKRGYALLIMLQKKQRFVKVPEAVTSSSFKIQDQDLAGRLFISRSDAWLVTPNDDPTWLMGIPNELDARHVALTDYQHSTFVEDRRRSMELELPNLAWTQKDMEVRVLSPLFRDAKWVRITDRIIGEYGNNGGVASNFRESLEWIFSQFVIHSTKKKAEVPFEIVTQFGKRTNAADRLQIESAALEWTKLLSQQYDFPVRVQWSRSPLGHDRYLMTNQIRVFVSRGFDLLAGRHEPKDRRRVRDVFLRAMKPEEY